MLYDGAIKFISDAKQEIGRKNFIESNRLLSRARNIIIELLRILDLERGGDIAKNLQRLYTYAIGRLIEVSFTKGYQPVGQCAHDPSSSQVCLGRDRFRGCRGDE